MWFRYKPFQISSDRKYLSVLAQGQPGVNRDFRIDGSLADYGWITNASGDTVWQMEVSGSYPGGTTHENILDLSANRFFSISFYGFEN